MKKRLLLYAIFGLVFYLLFLIVEMPASWFAWGLNQYTHGTVRLDPNSGNLWSGNGKLVVYYPQSTPHDLGTAEWNINPFWLFAGRLQMRWQTSTQDTSINTTLHFCFGQTQLVDTDIAFPAQSVSSFYPAAALLSPKGQVRVHTANLSIDQNGIEGSGEILWQNAGSTLSGVQPLGDYRLEITGEGKTVNLKMSTTRGALWLSGQGKWQVQGGQLQLNGSAVPRERAGELEPLLRLLGEDQGSGKRPLTLNARLLPPF
jgi:general secretion pathway protein N